MSTVLLAVHPHRQAAADLAVEARAWWEKRGRSVVELHDLALDEAPPPMDDIELAVSLGGDGTMLRTVELALPARVPVLGVNLGRMGYLTEVEPSGIADAFERVLNADFVIEERMALEVEISGSRTGHFIALNEAIVEKTEPGHTIHVAVDIAGRPFLTYVADGLLVSTPTGSTAYNFSARGPVVSPRLRALVLTPVSPHLLFDRSLVLEPEEWVRFRVLDGRSAVAVVDGARVVRLAIGDEVICRAAAEPARLVSFGERDFHAVLRARFGLTDR
jgi:NAD+ kinase